MSFFRLEKLVKRYGELVATDNATLEVRHGEIHALIGPNGAGKSTLIDLITGLKAPDAGRVLLDGQDITQMPTHRRIQAGLSRCFQITSIFREMTVLDNLLLAVQGHEGRHLDFIRARAKDKALEDNACELAARVGLEAALSKIAGTLAHAAQRQLDVALALASRPKLLLLDEPMAGMGPEDSERMTHLIRDLKRDMAILLIEHDMKAVFALADRMSVLVYGKVLVSGSVDEVRGDPRVQSVYLGNEESSEVAA